MAGGYKHQPEGMAALAAQIKGLQTQINELRNAANIRNSRISGGAGLASGDFDGDLNASDFGTQGWAIGNGNAVFNVLNLRGGIIGNDALTNPVVPDWVYGSATNFSVSTSLVNKLTIPATVPAGCTRLATIAVGRVFAINSTASVDYLYGQQNVAGFNGNAFPIAATGSGGSALNTSPYAVLLTGLTPGATVSFQMAVQTANAGWASNASNSVDIAALLLWFR